MGIVSHLINIVYWRYDSISHITAAKADIRFNVFFNFPTDDPHPELVLALAREDLALYPSIKANFDAVDRVPDSASAPAASPSAFVSAPAAASAPSASAFVSEPAAMAVDSHGVAVCELLSLLLYFLPVYLCLSHCPVCPNFRCAPERRGAGGRP